VAAAWRWSEKGKNHGMGEKIRPAGGGSVLKGSGGEGGPEGWASRGGRAGEREGERGALGAVGIASRHSAEWQWPGRGARGRRRCHATVKGDEVEATRNDAADRWART
jgi:hypothetical protein